MPALWPMAKTVLKRIPAVRAVASAYREHTVRRALSKKTPESLFTEYYESNEWGGCTSRSGPGSELEVTAGFRDRLPVIWRQLSAYSILDIPCGDFVWMRNVDLAGFSYLGVDVVAPVIERNIRDYARDGVAFRRIDLVNEPLPRADLIFCRDCLVHFSFEDTKRALANIRASGATWLMTTQFPETRANVDIVTGQWRPLNFFLPPFNFPVPHMMLQEISEPAFQTLQKRWRLSSPAQAALLAQWRDKSIAIWRVSDLV